MRQRDSSRSGRPGERIRRRGALAPWLKALMGSLVVVGVLGTGVTSLQDEDHHDGSASALVPSRPAEADAHPPQEIEVVHAAEEKTVPDASALPDLIPAPDEPTEVPEAETVEAPVEPGAADDLGPAEVSVDEEVPTGGGETLHAGGSTKTVATVAGTGSITLGFTRTAGSTAPNLPTYVSTICDGSSVYSGAFNTTTQGPVVQEVPYSGAACSIRVRVAQPSDRWTGTSSSVVVTRDQPEAQPSGAPYVEKAEWTTTAVSGGETFEIDVPEGFTGTVSLKLTACSSQGGTSDATNKFACGDLVQKGVGSEGSISISDGEDVLATSGYDITAETHHDMVTLSIDEPAADDLTISVERSGGSAVLVHGPGTSAVGTH